MLSQWPRGKKCRIVRHYAMVAEGTDTRIAAATARVAKFPGPKNLENKNQDGNEDYQRRERGSKQLRPCQGRCMVRPRAHSRTQLLPNASRVPVTRYHSQAPASHTATREPPCGAIPQQLETAVAIAAPQQADPPRSHPRPAAEMRTMSPTPTTVQQAPARTAVERSGGDNFHPWCRYFIHLIQRLAQNVGIWRRWESTAVTSLATLSGRNEEPTSSDIHVNSPFWKPLIRPQLPVLHRFQHHFWAGPSPCGPLLKPSLVLLLWPGPQVPV